MELFSGTSGFSYAGWRGAFYPEKMKPAEMLAFYAERLPAVEIHNTLYVESFGSTCSAEGPLVATAPYGYLRLRRPGYSREELASRRTREAS